MSNDIKIETLTFTSKFTDFEIENKEFTKCRCYALASGDNINGSDITMSAIDKAIERGEFNNKPIVAHLYKDEDNGSWRVGGHDSKWVITNTSIEIINECIPFGTIPESSNVHKEEVLEADGITVNTYVVMDILLWTGRFNIMDAAYSDDVYFNQSCEISINEYHYKENDVLAIDDFTFSALCLLNKSDDDSKNVRPCFGSCKVERIKNFSVNEDNFKKNYELLLEELKKFSIDNKETKPQINSKGGEQKMELKKFIEVLSTVKIENTDNNKFALLNVDNDKVNVIDMEDYKVYALDYVVTSENGVENLVIDFDSKVEMSLSACEKIDEEGFNEFSIKAEIDNVKAKNKAEFDEKVDGKVIEYTQTLEKEFNEKFNELKESYEALSESYKVSTKKLNNYEAKEIAEKAKAHENEINALFEKYSAKLGKCAEFLIYKAKTNPADVTTEEVNEKLTLMVGKFMMDSQTKRNFSYEPIVTGVKKIDGNSEINKRYGNLLDKYIK